MRAPAAPRRGLRVAHPDRGLAVGVAMTTDKTDKPRLRRRQRAILLWACICVWLCDAIRPRR